MADQNAPVALYIAAYAAADAAQGDWDVLKQMENDDVIELDGLLLVARDADGKIAVKDDAGTVKRGSIIGAVGGAVIGLLFPPTLMAGALVGGGIGAGIAGLKSHGDKKAIKADAAQREDRADDCERHTACRLPAGHDLRPARRVDDHRDARKGRAPRAQVPRPVDGELGTALPLRPSGLSEAV